MNDRYNTIRERLRSKYPRIAGDILDNIIQEVGDEAIAEMGNSHLKPLLGSRLDITSTRSMKNEMTLKFTNGEKTLYMETVDGLVVSAGEGESLDLFEDSTVPDQFWDMDSPETNYDSLYELADMSAVDLHKGDTMEVNVLCSKRLPSRTIKVWINDDEDVEYE